MNITDEKKIKVLFFARWYPNAENQISGIFIKRHAQAVSLFCDVCILYIHFGTKRQKTIVEYAIEDRIKTIRVYPKSMRSRNKIFQYLNFIVNSYRGIKIVKKTFGRPDIIHVNVTLPMGIIAVALDIFKGIPYVVTEHFSEFANQTKIFKNAILLKIILKRARKILPISLYLKQSIEKFYPSKKFLVIPNTIDTEIFSHKNSIHNPSKKQIIIVARLLDKVKNISGIIEAIYELSKTRNDFILNIFGDGPDRNYLENLATQLGINNTFVFFQGYSSNTEIAKKMRNSDFFILNSNYETFSVVSIEALSSGIPVISTRCGGPEEFINENVGILIEKGDKEQLIDAIHYMLDNSNSYDSKSLHEYAKNRFGIEIIGKQIYDIYLSVLK